MPDPKDNAKLTGDSHPPELEDLEQAKARPRNKPQAQGAYGTNPPDESLERELEEEARPGKGVNQAGYLKDKDSDAGRNSGRS